MPVDLSKDIVVRSESADASDHARFKDAGLIPISETDVQALQLPEHGGGLWPGITRPPAVDGRGDETASASREPWVDANGYKVGYLRALHPDRPAVLHYKPDKLGDRAVPFDSLELALIEAWAAGGNYILAIEPRYREALRGKDGMAIEPWQQLGRTVAWLQKNIELFRKPTTPAVTAIVDSAAASAEIANLLYRRNVSPALAAVTAIPEPDPMTRLVVVAANLKEPSPGVMKRILAHADDGATVISTLTPSGLKQIRADQERVFYALGKGQVVAYRRMIADPSEFALDVIDILTHKKRAVRLWNAPSVIALSTAAPRAGERLMHLVNYGSPIDTEVQARIQGHYTRAILLRPDGDPVTLSASRRGSMTEVQVPALKRLGVVIFG
jgi:hypothetical protein